MVARATALALPPAWLPLLTVMAVFLHSLTLAPATSTPIGVIGGVVEGQTIRHETGTISGQVAGVQRAVRLYLAIRAVADPTLYVATLPCVTSDDRNFICASLVLPPDIQPGEKLQIVLIGLDEGQQQSVTDLASAGHPATLGPSDPPEELTHVNVRRG